MIEKQEYRMGVGASSILMIFVILCITTLGVLSFANARANYTLTQRRTAYVETFQTARAQAQRVLAQIDAALAQAAQNSGMYGEAVGKLTVEGTELAVSEDLVISFSIPFGEAQSLDIGVRAAGPDAARRYEMAYQYYVNMGEWEPDETLRLVW